MNEIEQLLRDEISEEMVDLKSLEVGSKEYQTAVEGLTKLTDRVIEIKKFEADCEEKEAKRREANALTKSDQDLKQQQLDNEKEKAEIERAKVEIDKDLRTKQLEEEKKGRFIKNCIDGAGVVLPVVVTIWGVYKTLEFEKTGTVTTIMGRGFINKLLPKK